MTRSRDVANVESNGVSAVPNYVAGKNAVINGGMDVWQRGTSFSISASSDAYTADRWRQFTQANEATTVSRQATGDTTNLPNIQYCARIQRNSGQTGTAQMSFIQGLETVNTIPLVGKTVTLSFYARAGANFSPTSNQITAMIYTGTGTDQFPTSYTGGASVGLTNFNITTTWTRYSITGLIPTSVTELGAYFYFLPTGTAGTNDYFEITGVQLEIGSVATPFSRAGGTIQGELAACQKYGISYGGDSIYERVGTGSTDSTTTAKVSVILPVKMRATPSISLSNASDWQFVLPGVVGTSCSAITVSSTESSTEIVNLLVTMGSNASFGGSKSGVLCANGSSSARLFLSSEL